MVILSFNILFTVVNILCFLIGLISILFYILTYFSFIYNRFTKNFH